MARWAQAPLRFITLFCALCCTGPAFAQVDPIYRPEPQLSPTERTLEFARDLYLKLALVNDPVQTAQDLTTLLRQRGHACINVSDFQVVERKGDLQKVKAKCPGRPLYGVLVNRAGRVQIFGGDGMVGDFNSQNGPTYAMEGDWIRTPQEEARPISVKAQEEQNGMPGWVVSVILINAFIIMALILSFFWFMRAKTSPKAPETPIETGLSSEEKDNMVIESREILPDIYHHPDGVFLARGKRGKRRLFGNLFSAILYRDYSVKFLEIR